MITHTTCPSCGSTTIHPALEAKDHTVSREDFEIWHCEECTLRFTQNIPGKEDIGKYYRSDEYISHTETRQGFINRLYHYVRKRTLRAKRKMIRKYTGLESGNILDIGAGTGSFLRTMKDDGWQTTGLEPDHTARENAMNLYGLSLKDTEQLFTIEENYDAITMWHVLEHVHDLHPYLDRLKNILKPGGCLFIAVPNYTSYDAKVYGEHWAAWDVPRHLYHFSPLSMTKLLLSKGFALKKIKPMWYDSFYVSMLSEKYRGTNNLVAAVWNGWVSNLKSSVHTEKCSSLIYIVTH